MAHALLARGARQGAAALASRSPSGAAALLQQVRCVFFFLGGHGVLGVGLCSRPVHRGRDLNPDPRLGREGLAETLASHAQYAARVWRGAGSPKGEGKTTATSARPIDRAAPARAHALSLSLTPSPLSPSPLHPHTKNSHANVPEFWGRDSPYHPGTAFLGTPPDHLSLAAKRPVSPHVFEDVPGAGTPTLGALPLSFHYAMPVNALTSIANRVTGVALSAGITGLGWAALTSGDVAGAVGTWAAGHPAAAVLARAAVAAPLAYHYAGGIRHLVWDGSKHGAQAAHEGPLENDRVAQSSYVVVGVAGVLTAAAALSGG
jgi:succinate dehydrogenase (ubiquinone) cytochrome b560 subunit